MALQTEKEFTGDTGLLIVGILFCIPYAIYYYISNKETQVICPSCQESLKKQASVCRYCDEDIDQHRPSGSSGASDAETTE